MGVKTYIDLAEKILNELISGGIIKKPDNVSDGDWENVYMPKIRDFYKYFAKGIYEFFVNYGKIYDVETKTPDIVGNPFFVDGDGGRMLYSSFIAPSIVVNLNTNNCIQVKEGKIKFED